LEAREPPAAPPAGRVTGPPLVGRARERARLLNLWRMTEEGRAHLVLVTGEPGVGKTRLIEDLCARCAHRGAMIAEARCYAAEGSLAYGALASWLRAPPVRALFGRLDQAHLTELARLLPELLNEVPGLPPPEPLTEREQRHRLAEAATRALLVAGRPTLLVIDDLQWCDEETLQILHYLLRVQPDAPLMVAATARREEIDEQHPLSGVLAALHAGRPLPAEAVGGMQAIPPGATQRLQLDLEPGRYVVVCAVPAADGTPHYDHGMVEEVVVT